MKTNRKLCRVLLPALLVAVTTQTFAESTYHSSKPVDECAVPLSALRIGTIVLGQSEKEFLVAHPQAVSRVLPINNVQFEFKTPDGMDDPIRASGVTAIGHIGYNPKVKKIASFSLSFLDSTFGDYTTDLELFKQRIVTAFGLPNATRDWHLIDNRYRYRCRDYIIDIVQDYGAEHTAVGPTVMAFSRYSSSWNELLKEDTINAVKSSKTDSKSIKSAR